MAETSNRQTGDSTTAFDTAEPDRPTRQRSTQGRTRSSGGTALEPRNDAAMAGEQVGAGTAPAPAAGQQTDTGQQTFAGRLRDKAGERLSTQKTRATDGIASVAQAIRQSTARLRDERHDSIAEYVDRGAEQLERLSGYLQQKDAAELWSDAQRFARRRPAVFIGSAFVAGLVAARFLKSSSPSRQYLADSSRQQLPDWRRPAIEPRGGA